MGLKVSLDTNVFLAIKNKEPGFEFSKRIIDSVEENTIEGIMSTIVLAEVLIGFYQNEENEEANKFSSKALLNYDVISVNHDIAIEAAKIRARYNIKLPDAIIAASTIYSGADFLISHDKPLLKKLKIQNIAPKEFVENFLEDMKDRDEN